MRPGRQGERHSGDEQHPHGGDWLREIVFGLNDGFVTTLVFIMTVSAVAGAGSLVLIALSEIVAGGVSMALGGYLSARTEHDILQQRIATERTEIADEPAEERAELRRIYYDKGLRGQLLERVVAQLTANDDRWLNALLRDEHGVVEDDGAAPWQRGLQIGIAFVVGGIIPALPFLAGLPSASHRLCAHRAHRPGAGGAQGALHPQRADSRRPGIPGHRHRRRRRRRRHRDAPARGVGGGPRDATHKWQCWRGIREPESGSGGHAMVKTESPAEQRMILHHVSWETYQRLLCDYEDSSALRFTYDQGTLEIMTPQIEHEGFNRFIQVLLIAVEEVTGTELYNYGSTTFSREDLQKGFEADTCFYIKNIDRVRGKTRLDLHVDPPPDLVVEIDITHASLNKLPIYAQIGVPEVWRYTGGAMVILLLSADRYVPAQSSRAVPVVTADALTRLVKASAGLSQAGWLRLAREWVSSSAQSGR